MAFAMPLSGDDLPRRRRVPGRTSTLQLGEDEGLSGGDSAPQRRAPPSYPAEPAGGGYFGPDPTPREYNEMLAKQAGARRPGAAEASAALRYSAFELPPQQPQYAQQQASGWSGLAPAQQQPVYDAKKQYGLELQAQIAEKEARKRAERLEARGLAPAPPPRQQQQQQQAQYAYYAPPPAAPAESGWLDAPGGGAGGGMDDGGAYGGGSEAQRWEPSPTAGGGGYDDVASYGGGGGGEAWGGAGGGVPPAPAFGSAYPYPAAPAAASYAPPSPPPASRPPVRGAGLHELTHGVAPGGGSGWGGAYARGPDPAEAYRRELAAQVEEQRRRREADKREAREREAREEAQNEAYLRAKAMAAGGGGAIDNMAAGVAARGGGGGITVAAPRAPPPQQQRAQQPQQQLQPHNPFATSAPPADPFAHRVGRGRVAPPDDNAAARAAQAEQHAAELVAQIEERARARAAAAAAAAAADAADEARAAYQAAQAADAYERALAAKAADAEEDTSMIAANRDQLAGGGAPPAPRQGRRTPPPATGPWAPRAVPPAPAPAPPPRVSVQQAGSTLRGSVVGLPGRGSVDYGGGAAMMRSSVSRDEIAALRAALAAREAELEAARVAAAEADARAQATRERAYGMGGMGFAPAPPYYGMPSQMQGGGEGSAPPYGAPPPPYGYYGYPPPMPYGYPPPMPYGGTSYGGPPAPMPYGGSDMSSRDAAAAASSAPPEPERSASPTAFPAGVGRTRPARPRGASGGDELGSSRGGPDVDASLAAVSTFVFPSSGREWAATPASRAPGPQRAHSPIPLAPGPPQPRGSGAASPELPAASSRHDLRVPAELAGASPFASLRPPSAQPLPDGGGDVPTLSAPPVPPRAAQPRQSGVRVSAARSEATDMDVLDAVDDALTRAVDAAEWHAEAARASYDPADAAAREALLQRFVAGAAAAAAPPPQPSAALVGDAFGRRVSTGGAALGVPPPPRELPPRPSTASTASGAAQSARPYRA